MACLVLPGFVSCKSVKLSDAEEKQRIGEYYEAAAMYRKLYTKTPPKKRDLRGYIAFRMAECNRMINSTDRAIREANWHSMALKEVSRHRNGGRIRLDMRFVEWISSIPGVGSSVRC